MAQFIVYMGSGRAKCKVCGELILKTEKQVNFHHQAGRHPISYNAHFTCIEALAKELKQ